jgi:hypothetical protein
MAAKFIVSLTFGRMGTQKRALKIADRFHRYSMRFYSGNRMFSYFNGDQIMRKTIVGMLVATSLLVSGAAANAADINVANSLVQFNGTPLTTAFSATLGAGNKGLTFNENFGVEFLTPKQRSLRA